jgi:ACT domain-containing protein
MPLGSDVSANISELTHHGTKKRSHKQIVAISLAASRKAESKKRGRRG